MGRRVLVVGLDSMPPCVLFGPKAKQLMPCISRLVRRSVRGVLTSTTPPLTIPAWPAMTTGQDPGGLGLYGFKHRVPGTYLDMWIPNSRSLKAPAVWDIAGRQGLRSVLVGVPPSYPPKPMKGVTVGCFMTPDTQDDYTYPKEMTKVIRGLVGEYFTDIDIGREKHAVLDDLFEMTRKRYDVLEYLIEHQAWDLFFFVEIGLDRLHHAFWSRIDPASKGRADAIGKRVEEYYRYLDRRTAGLVRLAPKDAVVLFVSDHGVKAQKGSFLINQWLIKEGYLRLKTHPRGPAPIEKARVDWKRTKAWALGGHYARIFLNMEGREPQGAVSKSEAPELKRQLRERITALAGPDGQSMDNTIIDPADIYNVRRGDCPDLMAFFGGLSWRAVGTVGMRGTLIPGGEPLEEAVHDWAGVFAFYDPLRQNGRNIGTRSILDIAPTLLELMEVRKKGRFAGRVIREALSRA